MSADKVIKSSSILSSVIATGLIGTAIALKATGETIKFVGGTTAGALRATADVVDNGSQAGGKFLVKAGETCEAKAMDYRETGGNAEPVLE